MDGKVAKVGWEWYQPTTLHIDDNNNDNTTTTIIMMMIMMMIMLMLMMMMMMMMIIIIIVKISPLLALHCWVCREREYETTGQTSPINTDLV